MTEFNDDKQKAQKKKSFKEQILRELEEANRQRKLREEELYQKELEAKAAARRTAELMAEYEAQRLKEEEEAKALAEQQRLEAEAKALLEKQRQEELEQKRLEAEKAAEFARRQAEEVALAEAKAKLEEEKRQLESENSLQKDSSQKVAVESESEQAPNFQEEVEQTLENISETFTPTIEKTGEVEAPLDKDETQEIFLVRSTDSVTVPEEEVSVEKESVVDEQPVAEIAEPAEFKETEVEKVTKQERLKKADNIAKRIALALIIIIVAVLLLTAFFGYRYVNSAINAVDKKSTSYVQVEIPAGSGNKLIGQILEKAGLIKSATVFNYYSKFKNYTNYQSGYYNLQKSMDLDEIAAELQKGGTSEPTKPTLGKILITEGYTIKQIAKAIEVNSKNKKTSATPFKSEDFLKLIQDETFIKKMVAKYPDLLGSLPDKSSVTYQLEGYLFPATYNYYKGTTLEELVEDMISTMNTNMSSYYATIKSQGKSVNDILTLASLVEKEGSTDDDRRNIASVFYNRLNAGQALQSNIAILYAMGKLGDKTTLTEDASIDTTIDSPYNVYVNTGLMPGAVDSPSLSAIKATVNPASTDYYYFVADVKTGKVYYAKDYETHQANVEKYVNSQIN
ncbi:endolytic transglycosylase MltG [Streptococcus sp. HF-1907]|uniref:endolytic transglycosylase MltG n=1 Tax=Streptococcus sp. HF-1907 TaxID=2785793 RepID=UPI00189C6BB4|nr:endolytic transglycosylase MltG [Streptococcus sp. HF-1907]MBF7095296.1 endolytic transglycosylase MltG [Streptococcus sp. HF-1907]